MITHKCDSNDSGALFYFHGGIGWWKYEPFHR